MKCHAIQALLVAYLDREVTSSERALIQEHLAHCEVCRLELAALAATRDRVGASLQRRAAAATPSPDAWNHLQARVAQESQALFVSPRTRLSGGVSTAGHLINRIFRGGMTVKRGFAFAAVAGVLLLALASVMLLTNAAPASAQEIIERAYAAQQAADELQGIRHTRRQIYQNSLAKPVNGPLTESRTIVEDYSDPQTGKYRTVVTDAATGQVVDAWAFDGTNLYSAERPAAGEPGGVRTIYRTPQANGTQEWVKSQAVPGKVDQEALFEEARQDPTAKLRRNETWSGGREVFVLTLERTKVAGPAMVPPDKAQLPSTSILYFDVKTYQLVGQELALEQEGKETIVYSYRQLLDETLPAGTPVVWNLSDLKGIAIVDDPDGKHGDLLPTVMSQSDLAARIKTAYMLKAPPAGFAMQVSAPPKESPKEPGIYMIDYRNAEGDYIHIQGGVSIPESLIKDAVETYKTASGLTLYFIGGRTAPGEKSFSHAAAKAPDGTSFQITSNLPRERLKALAEQLVQVK